MSEDQFNQVMAKLNTIDSIAKGTAIQMTILFNEMEKLNKRMDSLEVAALGRRQ